MGLLRRAHRLGAGALRAATIVDSVRAANPDRVVLVDAGDLLQGNPLAFVAARVDTTRPHPVIAAMNVMRYDAAAIGNHDFNYGLSTLGRAIREASFPFLAANAYLANGTRAYPAFVIVRRGDVRVGIVGATTPGSMVWDRDNLRGRVVIRDIVPEVRTAVAEAREKGADVIVVTVHSGLSGQSGYDTVEHGAAERERRGPRCPGGVGHRPDRVRPLARGSPGQRDRHDPAAAGEELGDERRCRASRRCSAVAVSGGSPAAAVPRFNPLDTRRMRLLGALWRERTRPRSRT